MLVPQLVASVGAPQATTGQRWRSTRRRCPRFVIDGTTVRTITVAARFESVTDVTLDETRVELIHPEDDTSDQFFRTLTHSG